MNLKCIFCLGLRKGFESPIPGFRNAFFGAILNFRA
jgi:hypothetical protein